jgi:hypothetical protein
MSLKEQADITALIWAFNSHTGGRTADAAEMGHRDLGQHCRARAELRLEPGPQHRLHRTVDRDSRLECRHLDVQCSIRPTLLPEKRGRGGAARAAGPLAARLDAKMSRYSRQTAAAASGPDNVLVS